MVRLGSLHRAMQFPSEMIDNSIRDARPSNEPRYLDTALVPMPCCYAAKDRRFGRHKPTAGIAYPRFSRAFLLRSLSTFGNSVQQGVLHGSGNVFPCERHAIPGMPFR